jgi:hypothetical protein
VQRNNVIDLTRYPRRIAPMPPRPGERTVVLAFPRPATVEGGELPPAA